MAAQYPGAIPTFTAVTATTDQAVVSHAGQHTKENEEIAAIATELGTLPKGTHADVAARLAATTTAGTAAGQLLTFTAANTPTVVAAPGTTGYLLTADTTLAAKMAWKVAPTSVTVPVSSADGALTVFSGTSGSVLAQSTIGTAEGQILRFTAANVPGVVAAPGTTGYLLTADTTVSGKMAWKVAPASSSVTRATFGDAAIVGDATAGKLTITHSGGLSAPYTPLVAMSNSAGQIFIPDDITDLATNSFKVDLRSYVLGAYTAVTIASGGTAVVTLAGHGFSEDQKLVFKTTVNLPAEIVAGTVYYLATVGTGTFNLTTSASSGAIAATGTCSGVSMATYTSLSGTWGYAYAV